MKVAYYTEVSLDSNDGPAVNEGEFIISLKSLPKDQYLIFIKSDIFQNNTDNIFYLGPTPRVLNIIGWFKRYKSVKKVMQEHNTFILVCRLTDFPYVPLFIKLFNPKIKLMIKTAALWWAGRAGNYRLIDKIYNNINDLMTKLVYKISDGIDVAMLETHNKLLELKLAKKEKTIIIDNAINVDMFAPVSLDHARAELNIPLDAIVLGFAGSLPSQRGAAQILKTAEKLIEDIPNLYVLIVGHDQKLNVLLKNTSFPKTRIISPGVVPYNKVPTYIACMTICYSFFELHKIKITGNASQKVKQYLSMGKPVISVDVGHKYLEDNMLGSAVNQENIEQILKETKFWLNKISTEGQTIVERLHSYARNNLSTYTTFKQRLDFWHKIQS